MLEKQYRTFKQVFNLQILYLYYQDIKRLFIE